MLNRVHIKLPSKTVLKAAAVLVVLLIIAIKHPDSVRIFLIAAFGGGAS